MTSAIEIASRLLGIASALVALGVAVAGLTTGSRRRRLEAYYRSAADDEKERSPEREAILRSLQREMVGWSIADRAVPKIQLVVPLAAFLLVTAAQFLGGRLLAQDLAEGKQVWSGVGELLVPESPVGSVIWWVFFAFLFWVPATSVLGYYFSERRRIAAEYLTGSPNLSHAPYWSDWMERTRERRRRAKRPTATDESKSEDDLGPLLLTLKVLVLAVGSAGFMFLLGVVSVGNVAVQEQMQGWLILALLLGVAGLVMAVHLIVNAVAEQAFRVWRHPADRGPTGDDRAKRPATENTPESTPAPPPDN